ncbi:hypothetical protein [Georgenia muralis]|uniref:Membrane protein YfhO n=1 Tax=Georgenia muralis TaxID=154117 RepID=A0A3N4Z2N9_9MICO|nr:hypothetical protein [Georgenia muralis]RPF25906.1 hypothetical protein EDD32_0320 [Georgenia muralis]
MTERLRLRAARAPALLTAWAAPVLLVAVLLGPALLGLRLFAAGDLIDLRAPWAENSTVEQVQNTCVSDTIDSTLPQQITFRERLAEGDLVPLWNNKASAGAILGAAPMQGVTSPLFGLSLLATDTSFTAWIKLLEVAAAVGGTVLWGRRIGLSTAAGVLAGFMFSTSAFMVMWTNWPQTRTAAFFPLLFWAIERIVQDRTIRAALPLPLVLAALVLGGFPAIVVHAAYLAAAYGVLRLVLANRRSAPSGTSAWRRWGRAPTLAVGGGLVGVALVGFQIVPWARQLAGTDLSHRADLWSRTFAPREVLTTVYPTALGTCRSGDGRWGSVIPVEGISFVGAAALVLCLAALTLPRASHRLDGLRGFFLVGGLLTLGATFVGGPLNYVLQSLPLMGNSGLHRMRAVGGLMLVMLAAAGFDAVARSAGLRRPVAWVGVIAGPTLLAAAAVASFVLAPGPGEQSQIAPGVILGLISGTSTAVIWALVMAGRVDSRPRVALAAVPLLVAVEGIVFAGAFWPRVDPGQLYRPTATDAFLEAELGSERLVGVHSAYWGGAGQVNGLRSLSGHAFVPPSWRDLLLEADPAMFASSPTYHSLSSLTALESSVLDRLSVRFGVADTTVVPKADFHGDGEQDDTRVVTLQTSPGARTVEAGTPLRGAVVELAAPLGDVAESADPARLVVEVVGHDGTVLATGERRVRDGEKGAVTVAVAGESLASTTSAYEVRVSAVGGEDVEVLAAGGAPAQSGTAWVGVMVAPEDSLTLVETDEAQVYERSTAMPRFRWASGGRACGSAQTCAALMSSTPPDVVLLAPQDNARAAFSGARAVVRVLEDLDDRQRVAVSAEGAGMLVVADGFQDDWVATVDGTHEPIVRADHAMRGVAVPAGDHVVELTYRPAGWGAGPWVSGGAAGALVVVWWWVARRGRPPRILEAPPGRD